MAIDPYYLLGVSTQQADLDRMLQSQAQTDARAANAPRYLPAMPGMTEDMYIATLAGGGGGGGGRGGGGGSSASSADALERARLAQQMQMFNQQLGMDRQRLDLERMIAGQENAYNQARLAGDLELGRAQNQLQAQNMLAQRATRQLISPRGQVVPSMQPILGRSQT